MDGIRNLAPLHVSVSAGSSPDPTRTPEIDSILSATKREQILAALRLLDLAEIAERLGYLDEITGDDDPAEPPMELSSLRQCALFFASEPRRSTASRRQSEETVFRCRQRSNSDSARNTSP